ncbi:MAG: RNA polymerase-binding protein DksA [Casimicrobium sp.]
MASTAKTKKASVKKGATATKKPAVKPKATAKVAPKPAPKAKAPAAKTPAAKAKAAPKSSPKPAAKVAAKPAPKVIAKAATKPEPKTVPKEAPKVVAAATAKSAAKTPPPPATAKPTAPQPTPAPSAPVAKTAAKPASAAISYTYKPVAKSNTAPIAMTPPKAIVLSLDANKKYAGLTEVELMKQPESDYMSKAQLAFFKEKLTELRGTILHNATDTGEHLRDVEVATDPSDRATQEEEYTLELRTRDRERKLLKKVDKALRMIDDGSFGWCEETGEPIGLARLIARPTATLSIEAQERRERMQKLFGD